MHFIFLIVAHQNYYQQVSTNFIWIQLQIQVSNSIKIQSRNRFHNPITDNIFLYTKLLYDLINVS